LVSSKARAVNELGNGEEGGELFCSARDGIKCRMLLYEALWTSVKDEERNGRLFSPDLGLC